MSLKATLQPGNRAARSARHLARLPAAHPPVRTRGSRQAGEPAPQQQQRSAAAARTGASRLPHIPAPRISPRLSPASLSPRGGRGRRWRCLRRGAPGQRRPDEPFRAAAAQTGGPARGTAPRPQGGENGAGQRAGWGTGGASGRRRSQHFPTPRPPRRPTNDRAPPGRGARAGPTPRPPARRPAGRAALDARRSRPAGAHTRGTGPDRDTPTAGARSPALPRDPASPAPAGGAVGGASGGPRPSSPRTRAEQDGRFTHPKWRPRWTWTPLAAPTAAPARSASK